MEKTRQDGARQDTARQDRTRSKGHNRTGQDRTGHNQDRTRQDKTGGNKVEKGELRRFKAGPGRAAQETTDDLKTRCTKHNQYEEGSETV